jgi:hypothetical protein
MARVGISVKKKNTERREAVEMRRGRRSGVGKQKRVRQLHHAPIIITTTTTTTQ